SDIVSRLDRRNEPVGVWIASPKQTLERLGRQSPFVPPQDVRLAWHDAAAPKFGIRPSGIVRIRASAERREQVLQIFQALGASDFVQRQRGAGSQDTQLVHVRRIVETKTLQQRLQQERD